MNELKPLVIGDLVVKKPVIQGGMGVGISLHKLAGAVAQAGGVGIISSAQIGFREPDFTTNFVEANLRAIRREMKSAREISPDGAIGFNIMVATKHYDMWVKEAVKAGADIIISGAGLPVSLPEHVHEEEAHGISRLAGDLDTLPAAGQSSARGQFRIHGTGRYVRHADDRRQPLLHVADDHADVRQLRTNLRRGRGTEHDLVARRVELRLRADERALHAQAVRRETELHGTARVQLLLGHTLDLTVNTFNLRGRIFRTEPSGGQLETQ